MQLTLVNYNRDVFNWCCSGVVRLQVLDGARRARPYHVSHTHYICSPTHVRGVHAPAHAGQVPDPLRTRRRRAATAGSAVRAQPFAGTYVHVVLVAAVLSVHSTRLRCLLRTAGWHTMVT